MELYELQSRWDLTAQEVEGLRRALGGMFGVRVMDRYRDDFGGFHREQRTDWEWARNIITNEGINNNLDVDLAAGTQITSWFLTLFTDNYTPLATNTYATPGYTEVTGSQISETTRQAWTAGSVASQSVDNTGSAAAFTGAGSFTAYGASLVGGGTADDTLEDTAGGGVLRNSAAFSSSKAMSASTELDVTFTLGGADDGV